MVDRAGTVSPLAGIFCSRAPMVAGLSERKNTCWFMALPSNMERRSFRKEATPSFSIQTGMEKVESIKLFT